MSDKTTDAEHARGAAGPLADLLMHALQRGRKMGRTDLYAWERRGLEWLHEQWERDPATPANYWTHTAVLVLQRGGNPLMDPIE